MPDTEPSSEAVAAWVRLMRASRALSEAIEAALKQAGLPPLGWYDALHEIAEAGEGGIRPFLLVERMLLAQYNVSRLLARLEAEGLVEKLGVADDGRGQSIRITQKGRAMRRRIWVVYGAMIARHVGGPLSAAELVQLAALLGKLHRPRT